MARNLYPPIPRRGPVILSVPDAGKRLIAELFTTEAGLVFFGAFWPEEDTKPAAMMVNYDRINQSDGTPRDPLSFWPMEDDDGDNAKRKWNQWLAKRDQPKWTRDDARRRIETSLASLSVPEDTTPEVITEVPREE